MKDVQSPARRIDWKLRAAVDEVLSWRGALSDQEIFGSLINLGLCPERAAVLARSSYG